MIQLDMAAAERQEFGKGASRRLRRAGRTPAVLYGPKGEPVALSIETAPFVKELVKLQGQMAVINLDLVSGDSAGKRYVIVKEIQKDPVSNALVHADFYEIHLDEPRTLSVNLNLLGTPKGVDLGGFLQVLKTSVLIQGLPLDIPDVIEADISGLKLGGKGLTCGDLKIPSNVTLIEDSDAVCASVVHPKRADAGAEGEEEAGEEETAASDEASGDAAEAEQSDSE